MSKTWAWILGIIAVLGVAGVVVLAIMYNKEKKANGAKTSTLPDGTTVTTPPTVAAATTAAVAADTAAAARAKKTVAAYSA